MTATDRPSPPSRARQNYVLAVLVLVYAVNFIDRNLLPILLQPIKEELGASDGQMGFLVGFAAETENLITHAQDKLLRKGCDLIIANDVSQSGIGFDSLENEVTLCLPGGQTIPLPRQSKTALARELIAHISRLSSPQAPK